MPLTVATVIDADLATVPEQALRLEGMGFDAVFVGETRHNPFLPLALVAEHTKRIHFGTSVAIAFPRVPYVTANIAWDLAAYSGGRFVLGLGTQVKAHNERRFSVPWEPPGPHLRDYIACMRAIWDSWQHGTRPDYEGEFYQYRLTSAPFSPGPIAYPEIPVIISVGHPFNARLAGEVCDGIALHPFTTFRYIREELTPALAAGAVEAGRDPARLTVQGGGFIVTGRTDTAVAAALEGARREIAFHASSRSYANVMRFHGWEDEAARLRALAGEGRTDEMIRSVSDEMVEAFCVVGTWDELPERVRAQCGGVVTQIILPATAATPEEEAHLREVVAALRRVPALGDLPAERA